MEHTPIAVTGANAIDAPDPRAPASAAASEPAPRLSLVGISHRFGRVVALDHASLDVMPGEIVSLLGPSGCGKTTLLRIAAGIEMQTAGRVLIDGVEIAGPGVFVPAEQRSLGLVFQDFALFPHLTVIQNAIYGVRGMPRREAVRRGREALRRLGLERYENAYPHALSGGEQQRLALVRALLPEPRVMLFDEPFSGLDPTLRGAIRDDTIALLRERAATAVIVTHDPKEALEISDRVALMRHGRIVQVGTPEEVYFHPVDLAAARFLRRLNLVEGVAAGRRVATPFGTVAAPAVADGTRVAVALPPGSLYIRDDGAGVEARVSEVRFRGDVHSVRLAVHGVRGPVVMHTMLGEPLRPGAIIRLGVKASEALVFVAD